MRSVGKVIRPIANRAAKRDYSFILDDITSLSGYIYGKHAIYIYIA